MANHRVTRTSRAERVIAAAITPYDGVLRAVDFVLDTVIPALRARFLRHGGSFACERCDQQIEISGATLRQRRKAKRLFTDHHLHGASVSGELLALALFPEVPAPRSRVTVSAV
jgi:hypothetical protein